MAFDYHFLLYSYVYVYYYYCIRIFYIIYLNHKYPHNIFILCSEVCAASVMDFFH